MESYKQPSEFAQTSENHWLAKRIKVYGDLVTRIQGVQPNFPVDQVKGLQAFLKWQKHGREVKANKEEGKPATLKTSEAKPTQLEASQDKSGYDSSFEDAEAETTPWIRPLSFEYFVND